MEICYELYSPRIQKIEVLKLEKRLDDNLMYLRDALPEYSTVDPEMKPVPFSPTGEVTVNKVRELKGELKQLDLSKANSSNTLKCFFKIFLMNLHLSLLILLQVLFVAVLK